MGKLYENFTKEFVDKMLRNLFLKMVRFYKIIKNYGPLKHTTLYKMLILCV